MSSCWHGPIPPPLFMNGQGAISFGFGSRGWTSTRVGPVSTKGSGVGVAPSAVERNVCGTCTRGSFELLLLAGQVRTPHGHPVYGLFFGCFCVFFCWFSCVCVDCRLGLPSITSCMTRVVIMGVTTLGRLVLKPKQWRHCLLTCLHCRF